MAVVDVVQALIAPVLADLGLELYDLEHAGGSLRVTIDREGGVDVDALAQATRLVSRELDRADPIPGAYTLEVSSPGLERTLRRPDHFRRAVGSTVSVRTHGRVEGERRAAGVLRSADDDGIVVDVEPERPGDPVQPRRLTYDQIERARTTFAWGPTPKPGGPRTRRAAPRPTEATSS
jgi:ribosome maturation factor RimP